MSRPRYNIHAVTLTLLVVLSLSALAQSKEMSGRPDEEDGVVSILIPDSGFTAKAGLRSFTYEESSVDVEISGPMLAIGLGYQHYTADYFLGLETEWSGGRLEYNGSTWEGQSITRDSDDWIFEARGLAGINIITTPVAVYVFVGLGHRYWNNQIEGAGAYEREVQYLYSPLGVKVFGRLAENWRWGVEAECDLLLGGRVKSHLSDASDTLPDVTNEQDLGYGLRLSIPFTWRFHEGKELMFGPHIGYWDIDKSDVSQGFYEPANTTVVFGIQATLTF